MPTFYTLVTQAGAAKLANALATGVPLQITQMSVGDGAGNPVIVTDTRTALVRETFRASLSSLSSDPSNPGYMTAELIVPMTSGGYTVREAGLWDVDNTLIAYGNFPDTYKPLLSEGSGRELRVRMVFQISNPATPVQLKIDPTVVYATRAWVLSQITLANVAPGGTTGQVLMKTSNADGAATWQSPGAAIVNVNVRQEIQTAASGQTTFTLATLSTTGVAAYSDGGRIFDLSVLSSTQVQIPAQPAGARILFTQNEPNASLPYYGSKTFKRITSGQTLGAATFLTPDNGPGIAQYLLPPSPQDGDFIEWREGLSAFSTYAVRFLGNGNSIMGIMDDIECSSDGFCGRLVWIADRSTWRLDRVAASGS